MEKNQTHFVGLREAAERLGVQPWRIHYAISAGHVADVPKVAGKRLFDQAALEALHAHFAAVDNIQD
jgi:hypothetical protein